MKLKVNYDLIEKIRESKNGIRLHKMLEERATNITIISLMLCPLWALAPLKSVVSSLSGLMFANACLAAIDYAFELKFKNQHEADANIELLKLARALSNLDVKTTTELLKDAEVIQTNYIVDFRDNDKLPVLRQEKYIEVPLSNGYTETLLQEHNIGSKNYELSVQEPIKKMDLKLSRTL